jgi:hypothetical protein
MNKIILSIIILLCASTILAQSPLPKGMNQFNAGVGLSSWGIPVYVGFDHSVHNNVSIGGELSYRDYDDHWKSYSYHHSVIGISGNVNYHFNQILRIPRDWDIYAGLNLGFYIWNSPNDYEGDHTSGLDLGGQVGVRYYFSRSTGINFEFGGGNAFSGGKVGISYRY